MLKNEYSLSFFANLAKNNPDEKSVKITSISDFSDKDADFLLSFSNAETEILDLASGSGLIINKIFEKVKHITAIEAFEQFSRFIKKNKSITIVNQDIMLFDSKFKFDLVTMFGVVQYFNESEIIRIYNKYQENLKEKGKLIIKNQFGVKEDVIVNGYSDELKTNYYSEYRHIDKEVRLLESVGFKHTEIFDIYPPECNRWENTHFYAIVAGK